MSASFLTLLKGKIALLSGERARALFPLAMYRNRADAVRVIGLASVFLIFKAKAQCYELRQGQNHIQPLQAFTHSQLRPPWFEVSAH